MTKTALIIGDSEENLNTISTQLEMCLDYNVETAEPNEIRKYAGKIFDLVIIDGEINGEKSCFELYEQLQGETKFIFTGKEKIVEEAKRREQQAFLKDKSLLDILG